MSSSRTFVRVSTTLARPRWRNRWPFAPTLFFGGNCRDAFTRYQEIFGGELTLMTMKDVRGEEPPADKADMIIHAALTSNELLMLPMTPRPTASVQCKG